MKDGSITSIIVKEITPFEDAILPHQRFAAFFLLAWPRQISTA